MNILSHVCGRLLLVALILLGANCVLTAQETTTFTVESVETSIDDEVAVNIRVDNFINVGGLQVSFNWDPNSLEYTGVDNLPFGVTPQGSLNVSQLDSGRIGFFLADMSLEGFDLDNGSIILTLKYNVVGPDNASYSIGFGDEPLTRVVADTLSTPLDTEYIPGAVIVGNPSSLSNAFESDSRVQLSPNPFTERALVQIKELGSGPAMLSIFNVDGRLVHNRSFELTGQQQTLNLEANDLGKAGVYLLQISTDRGKYSRKFVFRGNGR